jgi:hypothetical protein
MPKDGPLAPSSQLERVRCPGGRANAPRAGARGIRMAVGRE